MVPADVEQLSAIVVHEALQLHRELGPGLLEQVYEMVLAGQLASLGVSVDRQVPVDLNYRGLRFEKAFRIDLLVGKKLIVEIKSVEQLNNAHCKQLLTYLRLTGQPLGLLFNFGGATLKGGIRRIVSNHTSFAASRLRVNQNINPNT